ncbi:MAG: hypothetical protein ATN36_08235 [Epulopiscium sp. Nele67-Bin005]|nr:MAG: hypothetical protein ATN36_08235 [Epulopiscium sp. Nele67-Bin005]
MLGKLLKYEIKATARNFLPIYALILSIAFVQGLIGFDITAIFQFTLVKQLLVFAFGALYIALFVTTIIVVIQRFNKNLLGDEGYLMFTLPVSLRDIILSKLIVAWFWIISSYVVSGIALSLFSIRTGIIGKILKEMFKYTPEVSFINVLIGAGVSKTTIYSAFIKLGQLAVCSLLAMTTIILMVYFALSIGNMNKFKRIKYFVAITVFSVLNFIKTLIQFRISWDLLKQVMDTNNQTFLLGLNSFINVHTIFTFIFCIIMFEATNYVLNKYLELS